MDSFLVYCSICCLLVLSTDGVTLTLKMKSSLPLKGSSLELSCIISDPFNSNSIVVWKESSQVTICFADSGLCKFYKNGYSFTTNRTGVFGSISSLTTEAEGTWKCSYNTTYSNSWSLIVYTIPPGLSITQDPNKDVDLNVDSVVLQCETTGCTYPMPTVRWIFRDQTTLSEIDYITNNPTGMQETCAAQEMIYTSTLHLPLYTRLNDNIIKTGTFSCRIEYPDSSRNIIASASHTVRFAVIVTLKPNNQIYVNNGGTLSLTCDVKQNIGFSSVFFRIESIIKVSITNINSCIYNNADPTDSSTYNVTCIGQKTFTMVKYGISSSDHNKRWNCLLNSATANEGPCRGGTSNPCLSPDVTVIIIVPVTTVRLINGSGQVLHSSVNIVRGVSTDIICTTDPGGSRPRALFQWYYRQGNQSSVLIVDQSVSTTLDPITVPRQSDVLISYSTWRLTGNASYHNMYIYCQAQDETNTGNYAKSDEIQLNIVFQVTEAFLQYNNQNITSTLNVTSGEPVTLTCLTGTSQPAPDIDWYIGSRSMGSGTNLTFTPSDTDHNAVIFCQAYNINPDHKVDSNKLSLFVRVRVTEAFLQYNNQNITSTLNVTSGEPVNLTCMTGTSRPVPNIVWYIGSQLKGSETSLIFTPSNTDHYAVVFCQAYNIEPNNKVDSNKLSLFVRAAPKILDVSPSYKGYVGQYSMIQFNFNSVTKENLTVTARHSNSSGLIHQGLIQPILLDNIPVSSSQIPKPDFRATIAISIMSENDFRQYVIEVKNIVGSDSENIQILRQITPEKPFNFHATIVQEKQLSLRWQSGYNGEYTQTFIVEISLDNITWNNVSQVIAGNRDGWFSTVIEDLIPGSEYYLRLYAYNINGRGDFADVQLAIRTLKDFSASVGISVGGAVGVGVGGAVGVGVGGAVGVGVGGIVLGLIVAIIAFTIRRKLNGSKCSCFRSKRRTDDELHSYSNTEMNPQTVRPIYEELNKGNTEQSVYDKISPL